MAFGPPPKSGEAIDGKARVPTNILIDPLREPPMERVQGASEEELAEREREAAEAEAEEEE